jgi:hypothetical protein
MRSGWRRDWLIVDSPCFTLSCRLTLSVPNARSVLGYLDESSMRSLAAAHQSRTASPASPSPNHVVRPLAPRNNKLQQPLGGTAAGHSASNMEVGSLGSRTSASAFRSRKMRDGSILPPSAPAASSSLATRNDNMQPLSIPAMAVLHQQRSSKSSQDAVKMLHKNSSNKENCFAPDTRPASTSEATNGSSHRTFTINKEPAVHDGAPKNSHVADVSTAREHDSPAASMISSTSQKLRATSPTFVHHKVASRLATPNNNVQPLSTPADHVTEPYAERDKDKKSVEDGSTLKSNGVAAFLEKFGKRRDDPYSKKHWMYRRPGWSSNLAKSAIDGGSAIKNSLVSDFSAGEEHNNTGLAALSTGANATMANEAAAHSQQCVRLPQEAVKTPTNKENCFAAANDQKPASAWLCTPNKDTGRIVVSKRAQTAPFAKRTEPAVDGLVSIHPRILDGSLVAPERNNDASTASSKLPMAIAATAKLSLQKPVVGPGSNNPRAPDFLPALKYHSNASKSLSNLDDQSAKLDKCGIEVPCTSKNSSVLLESLAPECNGFASMASNNPLDVTAKLDTHNVKTGRSSKNSKASSTASSKMKRMRRPASNKSSGLGLTLGQGSNGSALKIFSDAKGRPFEKIVKSRQLSVIPEHNNPLSTASTTAAATAKGVSASGCSDALAFKDTHPAVAPAPDVAPVCKTPDATNSRDSCPFWFLSPTSSEKGARSPEGFPRAVADCNSTDDEKDSPDSKRGRGCKTGLTSEKSVSRQMFAQGSKISASKILCDSAVKRAKRGAKEGPSERAVAKCGSDDNARKFGGNQFDLDDSTDSEFLYGECIDLDDSLEWSFDSTEGESNTFPVPSGGSTAGGISILDSMDSSVTGSPRSRPDTSSPILYKQGLWDSSDEDLFPSSAGIVSNPMDDALDVSAVGGNEQGLWDSSDEDLFPSSAGIVSNPMDDALDLSAVGGNEQGLWDSSDEDLFPSSADSVSDQMEDESNAFPVPLDLSVYQEEAVDEVVGEPAPSQVAPPIAAAVAQSLVPAATLDSASAPALPPPLDLPIPLVFTTVQEVQSRRRMGRVNKKYYLSRGVSISRGKFSAQITLKEGRRTVNLGSAFDFLEVAETAVKLADHFVEYTEKMQQGIESALLKAYVNNELLKFFD